jgi:hypothetical protein
MLVDYAEKSKSILQGGDEEWKHTKS